MNNVISTRVSVYRNLKDFKFSNKLTDEQKQTIITTIKDAVKGKMLFSNIKEIDETNTQRLKNLGLVLENTKNIFIDKKENLVINMFNVEHLAIISAMDMFNSKNVEKTISFAQALADKVCFAYSDEYGFLMSDISKLGAGLKIESNIMLTAIKSINKIEQVKQNLGKLGYALNETKFPAVYTLSTQCNLGMGEKQICTDFENTLLKLQELETESVKMLDMSKHDEIIDKTNRSEAVLNVAYMLNYDELYNILVNLRLGINLGVCNMKLEDINKLQKLVINKKTDYLSIDDMKTLAQEVKDVLKGEKDV
ncbi:MAG: hypothetical protein IJW36_01695 [Clostridia bacterium]|nr:hypothetical protein [Clostridia bacterium]